jgi:hypothetical protein
MGLEDEHAMDPQQQLESAYWVSDEFTLCPRRLPKRVKFFRHSCSLVREERTTRQNNEESQ